MASGSALAGVATLGSLALENNAALTDLTSLESLTKVVGGIYLSGDLNDLDARGPVLELGGRWVTEGDLSHRRFIERGWTPG